eukprot:TRINITY_DN114615_c0_g1_i1.p1 TRINITY_DN114615_c0_g1~~TRINITY_DN114615_c0_g1_i1.p1  ORF type:complete len:111 (-),score=34.85 TRINITY_DN114615_c0_g1_i1:206-538(-)
MARTGVLPLLLAAAAVALLMLTAGSAMESFVGGTSPASRNIRGAAVEETKRASEVQMHLFDIFDPTWTPEKVKAQQALEAKRAKDEQERVTFAAAAVLAIIAILKTSGAF